MRHPLRALRTRLRDRRAGRADRALRRAAADQHRKKHRVVSGGSSS